jgi:hypothetical protein
VIDVAHYSDDRGSRHGVCHAVFFLGHLFLDQLLFEGHRVNDAVESFRERSRGRHIEGLIDAGEDAAVEKHLQEVLGADVQFLSELAHGDSLGDRDVARLALHRRRGGLDRRRAPRTNPRTRAHRMQLPFALRKSLFNERAATRGRRLARVERLSGLCLWQAGCRFRPTQRLTWTWRTAGASSRSLWEA